MIGHVSPFPLYKLLLFMVFLGLHNVAASSFIGLSEHVLVSVVKPFFLSSYVILPFRRFSVKLFHIGLRVSLFVHALLTMLVSEMALHDRSAIVLVRGIQVIFCPLSFLRFFRFSTASALLVFCKMPSEGLVM